MWVVPTASPPWGHRMVTGRRWQHPWLEPSFLQVCMCVNAWVCGGVTRCLCAFFVGRSAHLCAYPTLFLLLPVSFILLHLLPLPSLTPQARPRTRRSTPACRQHWRRGSEQQHRCWQHLVHLPADCRPQHSLTTCGCCRAYRLLDNLTFFLCPPAAATAAYVGRGCTEPLGCVCVDYHCVG